MKLYAGIDPGLKGAWAILRGDGAIHRYGPMPLIQEGQRQQAVDSLLLYHELSAEGQAAPTMSIIEKVGPVQGSSLKGCWTFARMFEALISVYRVTEMRFSTVTPQEWKKEVLVGTDKSKAAAIAWCDQRWGFATCYFPGEKNPSDGLADALCMAEYGRRLYGT